MEVKQIRIGQMDNFCYLLYTKKTKHAILIDPGWDVEKVLSEIKKVGVEVGTILCTHSHYDHTTAIPEIKEATGAKVYLHKKERPITQPELVKSVDEWLDKETTLKFENGIKLKVINTPGHSPGGVCYYGDGKVFTGDTLFIDYCGRADLPGSNPVKLYESLKRLRRLPDTTLVYPGHNYGRSIMSTIGQEKLNNLYFKAKDIKTFKKALSGELISDMV